MTETLPTVAELLAEEEQLVFPSFTNDDAWNLGLELVETAKAQHAPIAIDIVRGSQQMFHAAIPGSSADNDLWIQRKIRVVQLTGHSSLAVGQMWRERGTPFEELPMYDPEIYAAHGGAFPVVVGNVGLVGVVAVSGLPQLADHELVVGAISNHLYAGGSSH